MKYVYPAVLYGMKDGYSIEFPDIDGAVTCGDTLFDALTMAEDLLAYILTDAEDGKIPGGVCDPSPLANVTPIPDEDALEIFVVPVKADTDEYRKKLIRSERGVDGRLTA